LLSSATSNEDLRSKLMQILRNRISPAGVSRVEEKLINDDDQDAIASVTPVDLVFMTTEYRRQFPQDSKVWGAAGKELAQLAERSPQDVSWDRISRDFGVPHPRLAQNYGQQLLNIEPFPAFAGYSSRLMAESWESNNLYWARLADEMGYSPVMLNVLAPQLTRRMVEKIFATDFEDWPALLRAMREAGKDFRTGKLVILPTATAGSRASVN
jgi:hypothetical protein